MVTGTTLGTVYVKRLELSVAMLLTIAVHVPPVRDAPEERLMLHVERSRTAGWLPCWTIDTLGCMLQHTAPVYSSTDPDCWKKAPDDAASNTPHEAVMTPDDSTKLPSLAHTESALIVTLWVPDDA